MSSNSLAIDFGTSNTAVAIFRDGAVHRLAMEAEDETLPTAVFFPDDGTQMLIGSAASEALIEGDEGRYMRALKSVLGTALFHEPRLIGRKRRTLHDIVTALLVALKQRAEAQTGEVFTRVLSGRPVHFHTADPERDQQAETDLRGCYHAAGFTDVEFMLEPEAAALASRGDDQPDGLGLIVDIGGGTSDFSVFRRAGQEIEIVASHGIRLGGTDFDQAVSMALAMPLLGLGGELTRTLGDGLLPVPKAIYVDLSTWAKIPFLYTRDTERVVEDMARHAVDPKTMQRLVKVIADQLGHELAFAVERGKIAANSGETGGRIDMGLVDRGLAAPIGPGSLAAALNAFRDDLRRAMYETLFHAKVTPDQIESIVLVGGSSLMSMVSDEARAVCPQAQVHRSEAFTAVVDGLGIAAGNPKPA